MDLKIAEAEVQFARAAVSLAKANLDATQVVAPTQGRILKIHARPGEQVPSEGLLELGRSIKCKRLRKCSKGYRVSDLGCARDHHDRHDGR